MAKNYICHIPYLSKHTSFDRVFCCTSLKWWHFEIFWDLIFSIFEIFIFLKFWFSGLLGWERGRGVKGRKMTQNNKKNLFIDKWEKEILRCAHILHMCVIFSFLSDFLSSVRSKSKQQRINTVTFKFFCIIFKHIDPIEELF